MDLSLTTRSLGDTTVIDCVRRIMYDEKAPYCGSALEKRTPRTRIP